MQNQKINKELEIFHPTYCVAQPEIEILSLDILNILGIIILSLLSILILVG